MGQAIRVGQERGEVARRSDGPTIRDLPAEKEKIASPLDFAPQHELSGNHAGIYHLTDDVTDEQFDEALGRAQDEQNVSRANVVRKVREVQTGAEAQQAKWDRVADMAQHGHTSHQIAREVGMGEEGLRKGARTHGIEFPADPSAWIRRRDLGLCILLFVPD